jgi:chorismate mutase/prephenate dehydratase
MKNERLTIGIQGGKGSFNEEALHDYAERHSLVEGEDYNVVYMHTTKDVLRALKKRRIDQGVFALHNAAGGIVDESVDAMGQYNFETIEKMRIKISHTLMTRRDVDFDPENITLVTHPQVLDQTRKNRDEKYPELKEASGDDQFIDHAYVAERMAEGRPVTAGGVVFEAKNIATMGSKRLAEIHDLTIVDKDLQDLGEENYTSFMVVKRRKPLITRLATKVFQKN